MRSFLEQMTRDLKIEDPQSFKDLCFVFPSKRAGLFFRDILIQEFGEQTFWSPAIFSIEEFVVGHYNVPVSDEITLIFDLYTAHKNFYKKLDINRFYAWGQVLLSDFEEIDRYMADADKIYSSLTEIKELDKVFGDSEEVKQAVAEFQRLFKDRDTVLINRFIQNWEIVRKTYHLFTDHLDNNGRTYKGRAFRKFAEELKSGARSLPYNKIYFAGFNALSRSEEVMITRLLEDGIAEIYFDCDKMYMQDQAEEAGDFLRSYKKRWNYEKVHWIETDFLNSKNNISFIGCTQLVGQAKAAGLKLKELAGDEARIKDTAIVLADENFLMPVLHALPDTIGNVNVTMGYPFRNTTLFSFISRVFRLNIGITGSETKAPFRAEDVLGILKNTLVSPVFPGLTKKLANYIRRNNLRRISADEIMVEIGDSWLKLLFIPANDGLHLLDNVAAFLVKIFYHLKETEADPSDREIIYYGLKHLNRFIDNLRNQKFEPETGFIHKLYQESFRSLKIPFEGEPLDGIQVMGFLETRALDFKEVLILGVNENSIPTSRMGQTYLPFAVRKAFGLPTFDEHDSIFAYHFKRILQRASIANIFYNTEVAVDGSGEKSRFILQLQYKLEKSKEESTAGNIPVSVNKVLRNPLHDLDDKPEPIVVDKSSQVMEIIHARWTNEDPAKRRNLTPTSITHYIDCRLRFYLKYIARVPEEELMMEEIDPRVFGNILHKVIEGIYRPFFGKTLQRKDIRELANEELIEKILHDVLLEEKVIKQHESLQGKDILVSSVIKKLVRRILQFDRRTAPIGIAGLEEEVKSELRLENGNTVTLGGQVDRIDQVESAQGKVTRVIDYKTGKVDMVPESKAALEDPEAYLEYYFKDGKYKSGFQAYFYSAILESQSPEQAFKAGIFSTRKINDGIRFLRKGQVIEQSILNGFRRKLTELVHELMDPAVPFVQTEDQTKCRVCAYRTICRR